MDADLDLRRAIFDEQPKSEVVGEDNLEFTPANTNFNYNDRIRITADGSNAILRPQDSYIVVRGRVEKKRGTETSVSPANFVNFGAAFLFSEIRLELSGRALDIVQHPGHAALMRFNAAFNESERREFAFAPLHSSEAWTDNALAWVKSEADGSFALILPLRLVLGLAEDFTHPFVNCNLTLSLVRARNDLDALIDTTPPVAEAPATTFITLTHVGWRMQRLHVSTRRGIDFSKALGDRKGLPIQFLAHDVIEEANLKEVKKNSIQLRPRSTDEVPHWIICGFQTARSNDLTKNATVFDHLDLRSMTLIVNGTRIPYTEFNINYGSNEFSEAFHLFTKYAVEYAGKATVETVFSAQGFKNCTPLMIFNVSHLPKPLFRETIAVTIEYETRTPVPPNTSLFVMVLHRKVWRYYPLTGELKDGT